MSADTALPIDPLLPEIRAALRTGTRLIVSAAPGAGKTTRIPLALMSEDWARSGRIILLEPRRIAARAAAARMAETLGEPLGRTVGLRTRLEVRTSRDARIEVVTEGVFGRMILEDPGLENVACVLFDEFHERSLEADLSLALALDAQRVLREDLRLVVMSATLPGDLRGSVFAAPVVESEGRAFPVRTDYLGYDPARRLEDQVAAATLRAVREEPGSVLVFLPGAREIQRVGERLSGLPGDVRVTPLYGALPPVQQQAAIEAPAPGERKVVLATDIAESSLTIVGVSTVVDCGFNRRARFDPDVGVSRLETVRVSVASADQRRGRAGRTQPGVCYRLWREAEMSGFPASASPEIETADITGLRLDLARWGAKSPSELAFLTLPREGAWASAGAQLQGLGALDERGDLTALGLRASRFGLPPRLALMVLAAHDQGLGRLGAEIAALLSERDLGGRSLDAETRILRFREQSDARTRSMRLAADRWLKEAGGRDGDTDPARAGEAFAAGFPERIARARPSGGGRFVLAQGRGARLDENHPLSRSPWMIALDMSGAGPELTTTLAAGLSDADARRLGRASAVEETRFDPASLSVRARRVIRLGALRLEETPLPSPSEGARIAALLEAVRAGGLRTIPAFPVLEADIARIRWLAETLGDPWPPDCDSLLLETLEDWLPPLLAEAPSLRDIRPETLRAQARLALPASLWRELDRLAPAKWTAPAGRACPIDYASEQGPRAECRVQEALGLTEHPMLAGGRAPLTLALLSPAGRPVAVTRSVPDFWKGGYRDMRKDMRGRYPRHDWPDDPAAAQPTSRAKPRR